MKRISPNDCPLEWWKANKTELPNLATLAKKFLSAPSTSVPSEQLFSGAGLVYEPLRNRLHGSTVEKLLFVKYNLPETQFKY